MYGYTGYSPRVTLYAFKEGKQSQVATRRKIGNYANLSLDCTPTGEAMEAVADLLDDVAHKRRILRFMTDGIADNHKLSEDVSTVLDTRGDEGVAMVIKNDHVRKWVSKRQVIEKYSKFPQALYS